MLRSAIRVHHLRAPICPQHRHFVSSVLLNRTYENESVAGLKKLLKERGLSQTGNKSTLITRIQQHDQVKTLEAVQDPAVHAGVQVRNASSAAPTTSGSEVSGPVPGIPPTAQPEASLSKSAFTNVNLPDLSQPDPEAPTPIPFYPDFYDSVHHPTPYNPIPEAVKDDLPKVVVVAGSATHHGGGPSHNAHDGPESALRHEHEAPASTHRTPEASMDSSAPKGFWQDVADDVGVPSQWNSGELAAKQQVVMDSLLQTTGTSTTRERQHSRPLDGDEKRGVWVLLGLLTGGWIVGGIVNSKPKEKAEH